MTNLVLIGDSQVGKSSLLRRFCHNKFSDSYTPTSSTSREQRTIEGGYRLDIEFLDTPGKSPSNQKETWEKAKGIIVVFSLTSSASFERAQKCMTEIRKTIETPVILVGNKQDAEERVVLSKEIQQVAEKFQVKFYEVSAKTNQGVEEAFHGIMSQIKPRVETTLPLIDLKSQDNTPRRLILQSQNLSQNIITQKIQEQMSVFKTELYAYFEEQRTRDMEAMEMKVRVLEDKLKLKEEKDVSSPYFPGSEKAQPGQQSLEQLQEEVTQKLAALEARTEAFMNENKELLEKLLSPKENLQEKKDEGDQDSIFIDNASIQGLEKEGDKNILEEIYDLRRRLDETDQKMMNAFMLLDHRQKQATMNILNEVESRFPGTSSNRTSDVSKQKENETIEVPERWTRSTPNIPPSKSKFARAKANSIYDTSSPAEEGTKKPTQRRKFSVFEGMKEEFKLSNEHSNGGYVNSETIIKEVPIAGMQANNLLFHHNDNADDLLSYNITQRTKEDEEFNDGQDARSTYRSEVNALAKNYDEEINLIWKTINTIIENTQDQISNLKTACTPTDHHLEATPSSSTEEKSEESPSGKGLKKEKNVVQEKVLKGMVGEVKDEVHNQILGVQREFENQLSDLKETLMGYYQSFSEKFQLDNMEIRSYIEENLASMKNNVEDGLYNNSEVQETKRRSMSDGNRYSAGKVPPQEIEITVDDEASVREVKEEDDINERQRQTIQTMQEEFGKSLWETISLITIKIDKMEQGYKRRLTQDLSGKA